MPISRAQIVKQISPGLSGGRRSRAMRKRKRPSRQRPKKKVY